ALQGQHYYYGPYLSPLYSPEIFGDSPHSWFGGKPGWWPGWLPFSPALLILRAPGLFRFTCYYYRGAYYKAFWADPPSCTVSEPRKSYRGEQFWPLLIQNAHRYFFYIGLIFLIFLAHDVWKAMWFTNPATGGQAFGIGLGTIILAINVVLLSGYAFGCHSFRHLIGGFRDEISKAPTLYQTYRCATCLNTPHMIWDKMNNCSVMFTDKYVRKCAMGVWRNFRL